MTPLTARERKLVAIGLLVAAVAVVWLGLVQPLAAGFAARAQQRDELALRYASGERLVSRIASLRRAAEDQQARRGDYALFAPDPEQGGEILRERLEQSLARAGGELRASETVEAPPGWVRASISAVASNAQMIDWLACLRGETPYLAMETLTISADRAINSNRLDLLDVKLEVSIPLAPLPGAPLPAGTARPR